MFVQSVVMQYNRPAKLAGEDDPLLFSDAAFPLQCNQCVGYDQQGRSSHSDIMFESMHEEDTTLLPVVCGLFCASSQPIPLTTSIISIP